METLAYAERTLETGRSQDYSDITHTRSKVQKRVRLYSCSICQKTFKRSEHCSRHERGHTHEKPFPCKHCGRRYSRKDIVTRHEKSFHPLEVGRREPSPERETTIVVETNIASSIELPESFLPPPEPEILPEILPEMTPEMPPDTLDPLLRLHDEQLEQSKLTAPLSKSAQASTQSIAASHHTEDWHGSVSEDSQFVASNQYATPESSSPGPGMNHFFEHPQSFLHDDQHATDNHSYHLTSTASWF